MSTRPTTAFSESHVAELSQCMDRLALRKQQTRPTSTYRLQFHSGFRFEDAGQLTDYLHQLGISHCYASPILKARAGSLHGYDITDHNSVNPELGGEHEFCSWVDELRSRGMGLILDIVPNHMGVGRGDNPWWQDVLENGCASEYADFFDIDWHPLKAELNNKVLIPVLSDQYGTELEAGHIVLNYDTGRFGLSYYEKWLPIDPQTIPIIFEPLGDLRTQSAEPGISDEERTGLENVIFDLRHLPPHTTTDPGLLQTRREAIPDLQRRLSALTENSPAILGLVQSTVELCNGHVGDPRSFDTLHKLLEAQAYRLSYWRVSSQEINYRRFFDINDLVGLRMEVPKVFAETHQLIRKLFSRGDISGIRLDHPDGLLNPVQYFTRVQMLFAASQCCGPEPAGPVAENGIEKEVQKLFGQRDWMNQQAPFYLLIEKILEPGEELPQGWPVDGTVGYDFTNLANGVFIDRRNDRLFNMLYRRFLGGAIDLAGLTYDAKKLVMRTALSSEISVLMHLLEEIASTDRHARDFTRISLAESIRETIACFPVYRTYIDQRGNVSERDAIYINEAIVWAKRRNPGLAAALFDFLRDILLLRAPESTGEEGLRSRLHFTLKFQQLTGPVMAKGLEDTVCYVYNRFVSVNEVGGSPANFGVSLEEFHRANTERARNWPHSMLTTSTHDTKRSEDVRARLDVLSEMPRQWSNHVLRWRRANRIRKRTISDGRVVPDANEEYLLYQTLIGTWPFAMKSREEHDDYVRRIKAYMIKAVHEAKVNLSWVNQNPEYVAALEYFIDRILRPSTEKKPNYFINQLETFLPAVSFFGALNSTAQVLLKLTCPGVPDIFQGNELWDFSLVDPDNRRPVDFELRKRMLQELATTSLDQSRLKTLCSEMVSNFTDGRMKMWTTYRTLNLRRHRPAVFQSGSYTHLHAIGEHEEHVLAFAREHDLETIVVAVPRFAFTLSGGHMPPSADIWTETTLEVPHGNAEYVNVLTGEVLRSSNARKLLCREIFAHFPVALLAIR